MATSDNIIEMEPIGYVITVPTAAILSRKKCASMGLNGFTSKKFEKKYDIKEKKILRVV